MTNPKPITQIKILNKTFKIIDLFSVEEPEWSLAQIVAKTGLPKTTAYRIMTVLREKQFLSQEAGSDTYRLGALAIQIGRHAISQIDISRIARPLLADLARSTQETAVLMMLSPSHDCVICTEQVNNSSPLKLMMDLGLTIPLHTGGSGKAVLAYMADAQIQHSLSIRLQKLARNTVTNKDLIEDELERIKKRGYAFSSEEIYDGASGISVPFFDYNGDVAGSVGVIGPVDRMKNLDIDKTVSKLKEVASNLTHSSEVR